MNNSLSVRPLYDRFDAAEIEKLEKKLATLGIEALPQAEALIVGELFQDVDEVALDEFMDRLSDAGIAADVYLPAKFTKVFKFMALECGSAHVLLDALAAIREDLDDEDPRFAKQLNLWKRFRAGAKAAIKERLVLDLVRM